MANQCVVSFNTGERRITMYFTEQEDGLDMQMTVEPEFKEGEDPDLAMLLASTLLNAIQNPEKEDNDEQSPNIIYN